MRTYIGLLIVVGAAITFSGCAERYYGRGSYYGPYGYSQRDHHHRRHDEGREGYRRDHDDRR